MIELTTSIRTNYLSTDRVTFEKQDVESVGCVNELPFCYLLLLPKLVYTWRYHQIFVPF